MRCYSFHRIGNDHYDGEHYNTDCGGADDNFYNDSGECDDDEGECVYDDDSGNDFGCDDDDDGGGGCDDDDDDNGHESGDDDKDGGDLD